MHAFTSKHRFIDWLSLCFLLLTTACGSPSGLSAPIDSTQSSERHIDIPIDDLTLHLRGDNAIAIEISELFKAHIREDTSYLFRTSLERARQSGHLFGVIETWAVSSPYPKIITSTLYGQSESVISVSVDTQWLVGQVHLIAAPKNWWEPPDSHENRAVINASGFILWKVIGDTDWRFQAQPGGLY